MLSIHKGHNMSPCDSLNWGWLWPQPHAMHSIAVLTDRGTTLARERSILGADVIWPWQPGMRLCHRLVAHCVDGFGVTVCGNDVVGAAVEYGVCGIEPWDRPGSGIANADVAERDRPVLLDRARHKRSGGHCSTCHCLNRHRMLEQHSRGQAGACRHGNSCFTVSARMKGDTKQEISGRDLTPQAMQHPWKSRNTCMHALSIIETAMLC